MSALSLAWTGFLLSLPVLTVCAALDRLLRKSDAVLRRRIWGTGLLAVWLLGVAALLPGRTGPGADYWNAVEPTAINSISRAISNTVLPVSALPNGATTLRNPSRNPLAVAGTVYLLVAVLLLVRLAVGQLLVARRVRGATPVDDPELIQRYQQLANVLGLKTSVRLLWSTKQGSPAAFGMLRCGILLPADAGEWSPAQRDGVLLHELAHLRHRDYELRCLAAAFCALQWFNPLAWLAAHRLQDLSEMAADEVAARTTGDSTTYATTLVALARGLHDRQFALMGMAEHALSRRIDHVLANTFRSARRSSAYLALTTVLVSGGAVGVMAAMVDDRPHLSGWQAQQIRWESATTANGIFLHGDVELQPGRLEIGREGLLLLVSEDASNLKICIARRDLIAQSRFECDATADPQEWLDRLLHEAAPLWPHNPQSPLVGYWYQDPAAAARYAGSHIIGIPGRSRNPDRGIIQAGWIGPDGARVGVFSRRDAFTVAFSYRPDTRELHLVRQRGNNALVAWEGGRWVTASSGESKWWQATIARLNVGEH